jgi:hypothetical protein
MVRVVLMGLVVVAVVGAKMGSMFIQQENSIGAGRMAVVAVHIPD